jgi:hypothetical protein
MLGPTTYDLGPVSVWSAKTRVDRDAPKGAGIHPPSPGVPPLQRDQGPRARRRRLSRAATCRSAFDCPAVAFREPARPRRSDRCRPLQWAPTPASIVRAHKSRRAARRRNSTGHLAQIKAAQPFNVSRPAFVSTGALYRNATLAHRIGRRRRLGRGRRGRASLPAPLSSAPNSQDADRSNRHRGTGRRSNGPPTRQLPTLHHGDRRPWNHDRGIPLPWHRIATRRPELAHGQRQARVCPDFDDARVYGSHPRPNLAREMFSASRRQVHAHLVPRWCHRLGGGDVAIAGGGDQNGRPRH